MGTALLEPAQLPLEEREWVPVPRPVRTQPSRPGAESVPGGTWEPAGEPTLEDLISGAWEGLVAPAGSAAVMCPACGGDMRPVLGADSAVTGGSCRDCGAGLA